MSRKSDKSGRRPSWMNEIPTKLKQKTEAYEVDVSRVR